MELWLLFDLLIAFINPMENLDHDKLRARLIRDYENYELNVELRMFSRVIGLIIIEIISLNTNRDVNYEDIFDCKHISKYLIAIS